LLAFATRPKPESGSKVRDERSGSGRGVIQNDLPDQGALLTHVTFSFVMIRISARSCHDLIEPCRAFRVVPANPFDGPQRPRGGARLSLQNLSGSLSNRLWRLRDNARLSGQKARCEIHLHTDHFRRHSTPPPSTSRNCRWSQIAESHDGRCCKLSRP